MKASLPTSPPGSARGGVGHDLLGPVAGHAVAACRARAAPGPRPGSGSGAANGQRVWKVQPDGGAAGEGRSPVQHDAGRGWRPRPGRAPGSADSSARVYGWSGRLEDVVAGAQLHDATEVHHRDAVAEVLDDARLWATNSTVRFKPSLQVAQQVEDLRLDRDVEGRHRLVGHEEAGLHRQGAGDADALALAAAELVRVAAGVVRLEADQLERLVDPAGAAPCAGTPWTRRPSAMLSPMVARGSSDANGSWNTICIWARSRRSSCPLAASRS